MWVVFFLTNIAIWAMSLTARSKNNYLKNLIGALTIVGKLKAFKNHSQMIKITRFNKWTFRRACPLCSI